MGLAELKEEILQKARDEAKAVENEAKEKAAEVQQQTKRDIAAIEQKAWAELDQEKQALMRRELAAERAAAKRSLQDERKRLIDACFAAAAERLARLPQQRRQEILGRLLEKARQGLEVARVYTNAEDIRLVSGVQAFSMDMLGGCIAENSDKSIRLDLRFETMLDRIREDSIDVIGRMLWP